MPSTATITSTDFTSFTAGAKIKSAEVNNNFSVFRGHILPVSPSASAAVNNTYDLGSSTAGWSRLYTGLVDFNGQSQIMSGTVDPSSVATSAPIGSLYLNSSDGSLYRKLDAGSSTNWMRVGDKLESTFSTAAWPITANQYGDLTSISLATGRWLLFGMIYSDNNGAVTTTELQLGISTTSGNSSSGLSFTTNTVSVSPITTTSGATRSLVIPGVLVTPGATTTYYLKGYAGTSITNLRAGGTLRAYRF